MDQQRPAERTHYIDMLFESTTLLLGSIVHSLETGDETRWDDHMEAGRQCIYELFQMSRSASRTYRRETNPKFHPVTLAVERAVRAIPHVKLMNMAVRQKDRTAAIESGRAAIAEMNGRSTFRPPVPAIGPTANSKDSDNDAVKAAPSINRSAKSAPNRSAGAKRRTARVLTANSR